MGWIRKRKLRRLRIETLEQMLADARKRASDAALKYRTDIRFDLLSQAGAEEDLARDIVEVITERTTAR